MIKMIKMNDLTITLVSMAYAAYQNDQIESAGLTISWDKGDYGFGELSIMTNGSLCKIDTESMGKKFFLDLMSKLYDIAEVK